MRQNNLESIYKNIKMMFDEKEDKLSERQNSILKEYITLKSTDRMIDIISGKDTCDKKQRDILIGKMMQLYCKAIWKDERIRILYDLCALNYDKDQLLELVHYELEHVKNGFEFLELLDILFNLNRNKNEQAFLLIGELSKIEKWKPIDLWQFSERLEKLRAFKYLDCYLELAVNEKLGSSRQMIVLLVGKSKNETVLPLLFQLLKDEVVKGHALEALSNFKDNEKVTLIMREFQDYPVAWIRNVALKYLRKPKHD